ncbi:hypothetical protein BC938DRAFT_472123 [Jimgerdemannia flammicorona]|uniref:BTB domain-containing protein n=1 Tax=Jimgerdemannia flammicorona TaxID=994334 RepID=A0A433QU52_9FUNG|nr:hypothetical protein BC938DRAFT_472123 [Jimgerdemannia flammicorona]
MGNIVFRGSAGLNDADSRVYPPPSPAIVHEISRDLVPPPQSRIGHPSSQPDRTAHVCVSATCRTGGPLLRIPARPSGADCDRPPCVPRRRQGEYAKESMSRQRHASWLDRIRYIKAPWLDHIRYVGVLARPHSAEVSFGISPPDSGRMHKQSAAGLLGPGLRGFRATISMLTSVPSTSFNSSIVRRASIGGTFADRPQAQLMMQTSRSYSFVAKWPVLVVWSMRKSSGEANRLLVFIDGHLNVGKLVGSTCLNMYKNDALPSINLVPFAPYCRFIQYLLLRLYQGSQPYVLKKQVYDYMINGELSGQITCVSETNGPSVRASHRLSGRNENRLHVVLHATLVFSRSLPSLSQPANASTADPKTPRDLKADIKALHNDARFHDVVIRCSDGVELGTNRTIAASRCDVFKAMLYGPMQEGRSRIVQLNEIGSEALDIVLSYMYTEKLPYMTRTTTVDVYAAADFLLLDNMKAAVIESMECGFRTLDVSFYQRPLSHACSVMPPSAGNKEMYELLLQPFQDQNINLGDLSELSVEAMEYLLTQTHHTTFKTTELGVLLSVIDWAWKMCAEAPPPQDRHSVLASLDISTGCGPVIAIADPEPRTLLLRMLEHIRLDLVCPHRLSRIMEAVDVFAVYERSPFLVAFQKFACGIECPPAHPSRRRGIEGSS